MTVDEILADLEKVEQERADILEASEARFADPDSTVEVRGAYALDDDGNPTSERDEHAGLTDAEVARLAELDASEAVLSARAARAAELSKAKAKGKEARSYADIQFSAGHDDVDPLDERNAWTAPLTELRSQLDQSLTEGRASDDVAHSIVETLSSVRADNPDHERGLLRFALATASPEYRSAFGKVLSNKSMMLTPDESRMMARVDETRAAITVATGLSFPIDIDPSFTHTGTQAQHSWREIATVKSGTENLHHVNVFGSATMAMAADGAEVASDGTPADSSVTLTAQTLHGVLRYTIASAQHADSLVTELGVAAADAIGVVESDQFTNGTGTAPEVEGLLDDTTITRVTGTIDKFTEADVIELYDALATRYIANATWQTSRSAIADLRQLENTAGFRIGMAGTVADASARTIMGMPWYENSELPGPTAPTVWTTGDVVAIFGDIAQAYRIYDVVGSATVEFIPHMFGTSANLPNGTRGLYVRKRMAAGIVNAAAAKCLAVG